MSEKNFERIQEMMMKNKHFNNQNCQINEESQSNFIEGQK